MANKELKPCPFCGNEVKPYIVRNGDLCLMMIECKNSECCATMSFGKYSFDKTPGVTVKHYNKRAGESCE